MCYKAVILGFPALEPSLDLYSIVILVTWPPWVQIASENMVDRIIGGKAPEVLRSVPVEENVFPSDSLELEASEYMCTWKRPIVLPHFIFVFPRCREFLLTPLYMYLLSHKLATMLV